MNKKLSITKTIQWTIEAWQLEDHKGQNQSNGVFWSYTFSQQIATPVKFNIAPNKKVVGRLLSFLRC